MLPLSQETRELSVGLIWNYVFINAVIQKMQELILF